MKKVCFILPLLLLFATSLLAQLQSGETTAAKADTTAEAPVFRLVENPKTYQDTCHFYTVLGAATQGQIGLLMNGTDLADAFVWTRCDCSGAPIRVAKGENWITDAVYSNAIKISYTPVLNSLYAIWTGNTTKFLIKNRR